MKTFLFVAFLLSTLRAQPLPVIPMQTDPDQLAQSLRKREPLPAADCKALDLWECGPRDPARITDISIRWVQLDEDPELEAILVMEAPAEYTYAAYIFDKQGVGWNLVGSFFDRPWSSDGQELIRVRKLTGDSPRLVLVNRDRSGSDAGIFTTEAFQLRGGKLWPVITITNLFDNTIPPPYVERQQVLSSDQRLVIHTYREQPPGHVVRNKCEVSRWDAAFHAFVAVPAERNEYCDPRTGRPIEGKSFWAGLPTYP